MYPNVPHPDPKGDQLNRVIAPALEWYAAERAKHVKETSKDVNVINAPTVSKAHINNPDAAHDFCVFLEFSSLEQTSVLQRGHAAASLRQTTVLAKHDAMNLYKGQKEGHGSLVCYEPLSTKYGKDRIECTASRSSYASSEPKPRPIPGKDPRVTAELPAMYYSDLGADGDDDVDLPAPWETIPLPPQQDPADILRAMNISPTALQEPTACAAAVRKLLDIDPP